MNIAKMMSITMMMSAESDVWDQSDENELSESDKNRSLCSMVSAFCLYCWFRIEFRKYMIQYELM